MPAAAPAQSLLDQAADRAMAFVRSSGRFQEACDEVFAQLDVRGSGRVASRDAVAASNVFFLQLNDALQAYGLAIERPSAAEIRELLTAEGLGGHSALDRGEFERLFAAVLRLAAQKGGRSLLRKYGVGMAAGVAGVFLAKRAVRAVPVVGLVAAPLLMLVPTLLVGPVVGELSCVCSVCSVCSALCLFRRRLCASSGRHGNTTNNTRSTSPPTTPNNTNTRRRRRLLPRPRRPLGAHRPLA